MIAIPWQATLILRQVGLLPQSMVNKPRSILSKEKITLLRKVLIYHRHVLSRLLRLIYKQWFLMQMYGKNTLSVIRSEDL